MNKDMRPKQYLYWEQLMEHLHGDTSVFFSENFVYPRQLEIHLPGNHNKACLLGCSHCAGRYFQKDLGTWELDGLEILNKLKGKVPYHIYGGAYTEPILNPYFLTYLATTKRHGNHFGIHTSGIFLDEMENKFGFLTELNRISTDNIDYLSISLDAGSSKSWQKTKKGKEEWFDGIIEGLRKAVRIREKAGKGHAIRVCYLMFEGNESLEDIEKICTIVKDLKVDSLRFSIPFAHYNQDFDTIRRYKNKKERPYSKIFEERLEPFLSKSQNERPYIFYTGPEFTDIDKFSFNKCIYSYYQITFGADGYYYRCSTTATPTMKMCRLGKIDSDIEKFHQLMSKNMNNTWNANICFSKGARCNRMGLEINLAYQDLETKFDSFNGVDCVRATNLAALSKNSLSDWRMIEIESPGFLPDGL
ncbi:MAG: hypothetical protein DRJ64_06760 [Thermoprotei archaeon]|nr:MAG: hypothetical protein DRJ64_06760 [Thermoprotei archaeon]